jgi:hypothetical protein
VAKIATTKAALQPDAFFQTNEDPSVKTVEPEPRMVNIIEGEIGEHKSWLTFTIITSQTTT